MIIQEDKQLSSAEFAQRVVTVKDQISPLPPPAPPPPALHPQKKKKKGKGLTFHAKEMSLLETICMKCQILFSG